MAAPMEFFTAIQILISPPSKPTDSKAENTEGPIDDATRFDISLKSTLDKLHHAIESDKRCRNIATALGSAFTDWKERLAGNADIRWLYAEHCYGLLRGLKDSVLTQMVEFSEEQRRRTSESEKRGPNEAPPLSPDTFSIGQQKNLTTVLQFIVCLGLVPNLQHGVGIPMEKRSGFGQILASRQSVPDAKRLKCVVRVLLDSVEQPSLGGLILTRHLGDLLAALLQICYSRNSSPHQSPSHLRTEGSVSERRISEGDNLGGDSVKCNDITNVLEESAGDNNVASSSKPFFDSPGSIRLGSKTGSQTLAMENGSEATGKQSNSISRHKTPKSNSSSLEISAAASHKDGTEMHNRDPAATGTKSQTSDSDDVKFFQSQLKRLLQKAFQPMVIRELLFLQGGPVNPKIEKGNTRSEKGHAKSMSKGSQNPLPRAPPWLRKECGRLLAERLMQPKGIQWVIRGLLDVGGGMGRASASSSPDWRKCDAVAHLIANCPLQGTSVEKYYRLICPQIHELLHFKDHAILKQVLHVASSCIVAMTMQHPQLAGSHLIGPLLEPLRATLHESVEEANLDGGPVVLVDELTLSQCIVDLHHVFVSSPESASCFLEMLQPVMHPLFQLLCFAKQGVCNLRAALEDILHTFFRICDKEVTLKYLKHVAFLQHDLSLRRMHRGVKFAPGSDGGAVAIYRPDIRADELFTEGLMSQEHTAATVLELLQKLKTEGLVGDFFIIVLKELTSITSSKPSDSDAENLSPHTSGPSRTLLDLEEGQDLQVTHLQHALQVLALLSRLCQDLGPEVLENTSQMLEFARATLDRAASSLDNRGETFDVFETETLTLAFGLVSAILSGDLEKKVTSEHRQALMALLPSLEKISNEHSIEPLQRTATDLRIAIATHGAVWSETMKEATEKLKTSTITAGTAAERLKAESKMADKRRTTSSSEIEMASTSRQNHPQEGESVSTEEDRNENQPKNSERVTGTLHPGNQPTPLDTQSSETRSVGGSESKSKNEQKDQAFDDFDEAFQDLFDPLLPTRGHALRVLGKLLLAKDPKAMQKRDMLVGIFEENLCHEDSYIYLSAIQALSCVADAFPEKVIPHLCQEFIACQREGKDKKRVMRTAETRVKLGEALVRATRSLGELVPRYGKVLLGAFLQGAQDNDAVVRASSLSNMADVCKLLRFSLGPNLHEVLNCLVAILCSDPEVQVRRACVLVLTLILRGLGKDAIQVLENVIRDIYRSLKMALSVEKDDVIRLHCQLALEEIDIIMREYLFPKQTLTKKITVLP